jgi:CSLREA domain-containing protein
MKRNLSTWRAKSLYLLCCALLIAGVGLFVAVPEARAATLGVTRADDPPPNGCKAGDCSLREAIIAANTNPDADTITLPAGTYRLTITGNESAGLKGDLDIRSNLTITGAGAAATIIDGSQMNNRVFEIRETAPIVQVRISGVTIRGGNADTDFGGGIRNNRSRLTLTDVVLTANGEGLNADESDDTNQAGALYNDRGVVELTNVTIDQNVADSSSAIVSTGPMTITTSVISNNQAASTGVILSTSALTVINSTVRDNTTAMDGGGIRTENSQLTLAGSVIVGNISVEFGAGGVNNNGSVVTITDSEIANNRSSELGGGIVNLDGRMTISKSTISDNRASDGGGIFSTGQLTVTDSVIRGNVARGFAGSGPPARRLRYEQLKGTKSVGINQLLGGSGGGIETSGFGVMTLVTSTLVDNRSRERGGGLSVANQSSATILNSTISGNAAGSDGGGAFFNGEAMSFSYTTIISNTANVSPTDELDGNGGGLAIADGKTGVTVGATIIAGNSDTDGQSPDCAGVFTSQGSNLIQNPSGCTVSGAASINQFNPDLRIGPLQNNGGPTPTHALLTGSPAIDAVTSPGCPPTDQRGITRPQGAACDVGAFEHAPANAASPTITALAPSSVVAGSPGFTLVVTGTNFAPDAQVRWNGAARATTVVSATQLSTTIAADDIAAPGAAQITVLNPGSGSESSVMILTVQPAQAPGSMRVFLPMTRK